MEIIKKYEAIIKKLEGSYHFNEPLNKHTTFKIGGMADLLINPKNSCDIRLTYEFAFQEGIPVFVMGWGSNLLFSDQGFPGIILQIKTTMNSFKIVDNHIVTEAGVYLPKLILESIHHNLGGFEFLFGIPGTIGGCACMNAGTNQHGIGELIKTVFLFDPITREEKIFLPSDLFFEYRSSNLLTNHLLVLKIEMDLPLSKQKDELEKMEQAKEKRKKTQPLSFPNAGCIWKNPTGYKAGKLIEEAGLKGFVIGGAEISPLHANFIINKNNATASDIYRLIDHTEKTIYNRFGITLEREIQLIGQFTN